jgi:hypothetical protein
LRVPSSHSLAGNCSHLNRLFLRVWTFLEHRSQIHPSGVMGSK